jgi:hypothetical protein
MQAAALAQLVSAVSRAATIQVLLFSCKTSGDATFALMVLRWFVDSTNGGALAVPLLMSLVQQQENSWYHD